MDNDDDFKLAGKPWSNEEDQQLINEYTVDKLNVLEICEIHKRKPGGITSRLKRLNLIDIRQNARGYSEYLESDLYKVLQEKKSETGLNIIDIDKNKDKGHTMFGLDKSLYPSRMGKTWKDEEVKDLLNSIKSKKSIEMIASIHQRTEGGIIGKLKDVAVDYYIYHNKQVDEIEIYTGLSKEVILEAIQKKQHRNSLMKKEREIITKVPHYGKQIPISAKECLITDNLVSNEELSVIEQLKEDVRYLKLSIKHILSELYEMKSDKKSNNNDSPVVAKKENTIVNTHFKNYSS